MGFDADLHSSGGATGETSKMYIKEQIFTIDLSVGAEHSYEHLNRSRDSTQQQQHFLFLASTQRQQCSSSGQFSFCSINAVSAMSAQGSFCLASTRCDRGMPADDFSFSFVYAVSARTVAVFYF